MNKGLEAFEILKQDIGACYEEELSIVETELKRLEQIDKVSPYAINYDFAALEKKLNALIENKVEKETKKLKALEIIKETPIFAWYVTIYKNAYEMVSDVKGFRVNNSVEELQEMFDLLKEVLL